MVYANNYHALIVLFRFFFASIDLTRFLSTIQNLRVTGHIETALDAPLCGMLKRLPENAALKALEVFSSCDLSKMRNKGAYLSGILKKELIKLGL